MRYLVVKLYVCYHTTLYRDPGLVGMLGDKDHKLYYGIIADGIHAHPNAIRMAWEVCLQNI